MKDHDDEGDLDVDEGDASEIFALILKSYRKPGDTGLGGRFVKLPLAWLDEAFLVLPARLHRVAIAVGHLGAYLLDEDPNSRADIPFQLPASALTLFGTTERQVNDALRRMAKAKLIHLTKVDGKPSIIRLLIAGDDLTLLVERYRDRLRENQAKRKSAKAARSNDEPSKPAAPITSTVEPIDTGAVDRALAANGFKRPKKDSPDGFATWVHAKRGLTIRILPDDDQVRVIVDGAKAEVLKDSFGTSRVRRPARGTAHGDAELCWSMSYSTSGFATDFIVGLPKLVGLSSR